MSDFQQKKRLSMDLPLELINEIKKLAIDRNCTLTKWVMRAIVEQAKKEMNYKTERT